MTDTAMRNEPSCRILCHNICCLIQSSYELGINATFWGNELTSTPLNTAPTEIDDSKCVHVYHKSKQWAILVCRYLSCYAVYGAR